MGLLPGVHDRVAAEVVGILEALSALAAGIGLLARVSPLVSLEGVHAGESLSAEGAGGHRAVGRQPGPRAVLVAEVGAEVQLKDVRAREHLATQGANADMPRRHEHARGDVRRIHVILALVSVLIYILLSGMRAAIPREHVS